MVPVEQAILGHVREFETDVVGLSHRIHAHPEIAFEEEHASTWCAELLSDAGFSVTAGVAGLPTAFCASAGSGDLVVGLCAEYDALPGIGHACGHNIIAAAAVGAATALVPLADDLGLRIVVFGTPAEERGGGKIAMLEAGAFDGVHAAMMVHPAPFDIVRVQTLAVQHLEIEYHGRAAHASAAPHLAVNAADALVVAQVAIGLLRQQLRRTDQVHGITTSAGDAPNVIADNSRASYDVRGRSTKRVGALARRVTSCFEAGATASGCTMHLDTHRPYAPLRHHDQLGKIYRAALDDTGRRAIDGPDRDPVPVGSTDMGNVSHHLPTIHPMIGIESHGVTNHQAAFTDACATPSADRAVVDGAHLLAATTARVATGALRQQLTAATIPDSPDIVSRFRKSGSGRSLI